MAVKNKEDAGYNFRGQTIAHHKNRLAGFLASAFLVRHDIVFFIPGPYRYGNKLPGADDQVFVIPGY